MRKDGEWYKVPRKIEYLNTLEKFCSVNSLEAPDDYVESLKDKKKYWMGVEDDLYRYINNVFENKKYHINSTPWTIILKDFKYDKLNEIWINRIT